MAVSCGEDDVIDKNSSVIIDPVEPSFEFDAQGVPFFSQQPTLDATMQTELKKAAIGFGWRRVVTNEILSDGKVDGSKDFYKDMIGLSPVDYYFLDSESAVTRYFHSDALNSNVYRTLSISLDASKGDFLVAGSDGKNKVEFRVWMIYYFENKWHLGIVAPICERAEADGSSRVVWGVSQYIRLSDTEMKKVRGDYNAPAV